MSGDVQPRKRKDKKKKRDDEASHGVHVTKMGSDDVLIHVQEEHGTGGHWCAKIIFFALMAILIGLVSLIILENRGLSDVDTPLSESRFSNYFDGWVDENRDEHDDHHDSHGSLEHDDHEEADEHDDEDEHDEPFEEEADHSEGDDEDAAEEEDDNVTPEEEDDDAENVTAEEEDEEEEEDDDDEQDNVTAETVDNITPEEADDDDDVTAEDENVTLEQNADDDDDDENEDDNNDEDDNVTKETSQPASQDAQDDDDDDEDDDGAFDSLEKIVDNDAAELELLKEKARQQAAADSKQNAASAENDIEDDADKAPSWGSSLTIKIGIGLALALVARLVLIRKKPISNEDTAAPEILMKRRLTLANPEENIPELADDIDEPLPQDDYSEEEIEIEEEIEYIEEETEPLGEENEIDAGDNDYVPETFEQLNAMYRPKEQKNKDETEQKIETKPSQTAAHSYTSAYTTTKPTTVFNKNNNSNTNKSDNTKFAKNEALQSTTNNNTLASERSNSYKKNSGMSQNLAALELELEPPSLKETHFSAPTKHLLNKELSQPLVQPIKKEVTYDMDYEKALKEKPLEVAHKKEITHDMDYQLEADDIVYDENDIYDDDDEDDDDEAQDDDSEELDDEDLEEGEDEDVSDVDDAELMSRLEAKYGKLPAKEYESDEDPDDPTWTQIKPKTGGGPQSLNEDELDSFERELRKANEEMMRERYDDALKSFDRLIKNYPHEPQAYLGKAQILDHYAEQRQSNRLLMEAIALYNTYLRFNVNDTQRQEYRSAGEHCIKRIRFLGNYQQALPIHQQLIDKFPQESAIRNDFVVTLLMLNRLLDAKRVLQEILQLWPQDGLALVHYGYVLKQLDHDYHNASIYLRQGIESKAEGTQNGRFYFQLGESLQRLGKQSEAVDVFREGAALKLFPGVYQRSLYNELNLQAQPFWSVAETTYEKFLKKLQDNWLAIQAEGANILSKKGYFMNETENLKNKGDWQQFELYSRGQQKRDNCLKAPITCSLIEQFPRARDCRRGQIKFSVMHPGTHIWPHCGPTNCRLRAHLGLIVPNGTRIRVAEEERSWQEGKFLIFDDSFEHEVWHEGQNGLRLVLIVDVWHPDLTDQQLLSLSPI